MKKILIVLGICCLLLPACDDTDNVLTGLALQSHDDNRMMDTLHAMMDRMEAMAPTNDPEIDYLRMMIMHHQGAISMANVELEAGSNTVLKNMAQEMKNMQQMEIEQFDSLLALLSADNTDMEFAMEQMDNMEKMGKVADVQLITGDIDNDFATLMMVHHQGAIDNSSAYLHHGNNAFIKSKATGMIQMQTMEINELSDWLKNNKR